MTIVQIDNDQALTDTIMGDMDKILEAVADEIVNMVKDRVWEGVYRWMPSPHYHRLEENGGFLGSWKDSLIERTGNKLSTIISSHPELMVYEPALYQHGYTGEDRRAEMDQYIYEGLNAEGTNLDWGGNAMFPRDYWSDIEAIVDNGAVIDKLFEREFQRRGIPFMKSGIQLSLF
jgi:hypothetical protein